MNISEFIVELKKKNITLKSNEDKIKIIGPREEVTSELKQKIVLHKKEIISFLEQVSAVKYERIPKASESEDNLYAVSQAQRRMYILSKMEDSGINYNIPTALRIKGELEAERLEKAFKALIQRHEALRTSFIALNGEPRQRIENEVEFKLEYKDAKEEELSSIIKGFVKPFDLESPPLLRAELIKIKQNEHIILFDMHHIISDGTSMGILVKELAGLYKGKELLHLDLQYKDYSEWQNEFCEKDRIKRQESYWLNLFKEEIPVLNLPADYERPTIQSFEGDSISFEISDEITSKLYRLAGETGATMYMLLLAAYTILLSKYSGQDDIVVGSPIAGRVHDELQGIIGMFVNTLAMRNYPKSDTKISDFLEEVIRNAQDAFENQDFQFDNLIEKLHIQRDMSRNPLFDAMFVLQNMSSLEYDFEGLIFEPYKFKTYVAKFDLTLNAVEEDKGIKCELEYSSRLFKKDTVERLAEHFTNILKCITDNVESTLGEIDMLSEQEKRTLFYTFNETKMEYPEDKLAPQLFEMLAEKMPDKTAVVFEDKKLIYRELNEKSNQLGAILRAKGVKQETIVAIMLERSLEMAIGMLAVLKSGGAYLPIDPEYPADRIDYVLKDSKAFVLLSTENIMSKKEIEIKEYLDLENGELYVNPSGNLLGINRKEDLAYVIYTSGTTGRPKGVMVEHRGIVNLKFWLERGLKVGNDENILQFASIAFDAFSWELFMSFLLGNTMYIPDKDTILSMDLLNEYIKKNKISTITIPPFIAANIEYYNDLKRVVTAGSEVKFEYICSLLENAEVINAYGPTEDTICTTYYRCSRGINSRIPIGRPISNHKVLILDKSNRLVPIGVAGELCITGVGIARGYFNNEALTKEKFIENPFEEGQKLYKTGDLARWLPDGDMEFLGRIDHQVKIRGFRIELSEIENNLLKIEGITDVKVVVFEKDGIKSLCAYFVSESKFSIFELREELLKKLPQYMVPAYFVKLDELPLNMNGKVDIKALPEPDANLIREEKYEAPSNEYEKILVDIWEKLLNTQNIGILDDFFSLGGDSIKAIQMLSMLNQKNLKIKVSDIFKYKNIKNLAKVVMLEDNCAEQGVVTGKVKLNPVQTWFFTEEKVSKLPFYKSIIPLRKGSFSQKNNTKEHFHQSIMLRSREKLDVNVLGEIIAKLQEYHDALRTVYIFKDGEIVQEIKGLSYPLNYQVVNLLDGEDTEKNIEHEIIDLQKSVSLEKGPLMNVIVFRTISGDLIYILIHHLAVDTVSWGIFINDMDTLYRQYLNNEHYELPTKTNSVKQWAEEIYEYANSGQFMMEKDFWKTIASKKIKTLPVDMESHTNIEKESEACSFSLSYEDTNILLTKVTKRMSVTMLDILLGALSSIINSWTGFGENAIMLEGHGRERLLREVDISRTMGWFTSFFPIILGKPESSGIEDYVYEAAKVRKSIPNNGVGYSILKYITEESNKADMTWRIDPEISFNYHGNTDLREDQILFELTDSKHGHDISLDRERDFKLDFIVVIKNGRLEFSLIYNTKSYHLQTVNRLAETYKRRLLEMVKTNKQSVKIDKYVFSKKLSEILKKYDAAGIIVGIASDNGKPMVYTAGKADIYNNVDMKEDTSFVIGSITKTFVATVILQLVEEKQLDLDKSIMDYIPEILMKYSDKNIGAVTVRNLLNHTSGIKEFTSNKKFLNVFLNDRSKIWLPEELLDLAINKTDSILPGNKTWMYSSTNYILLGLIIEKTTKMSVKENIQTRICNKLGLKKTKLIESLVNIGNLSHCYVGKEKKDFTDLNFASLGSAGGMVSNASELLAWLKALTEGELLQNKKAMFVYTDVSEYYEQQNVKIGLGVFNVNGMPGHEGHGPGFQNVLYGYRGHNIFIHINREKSNDDNIASDCYEILTDIIYSVL